MELFPPGETIGAYLGEGHFWVLPAGRTFTLASVWEKLPTWTAREQAGVLFIRNPLAFIDRVHPCPLAAGTRLERRLTARRIPAARANPGRLPVANEGSPDDLTDDDLRDYYRSNSGARAAHWGTITSRVQTVALYRGVPGRLVDEGQPSFQLFERLPKAERCRLVSGAPEGRAEVPLA